MNWLDVTPLVIAAIVILFGGGLLVTSAARLPLFAKVASAPAVAITVVAMTAIICPVFGARFGPWPVAVGFLVAVALAWGVRYLMNILDRRSQPGRAPVTDASQAAADAPAPGLNPAPEWVTWLAWAGSMLLMVLHWRTIMGRPDAFSQTYDNIFHMNGVRWVLETGQGSSLAFGMTSGDQSPMYYPAAWHDLVALTDMLIGSGNVALAINAVSLVTMGLVWTSGCLFLVRSLTSRSSAVILATGVLSASFAAFPFLLLGFGVLYPNFLGMSLLPAGLALTVHVLRLQSGPPVHLLSAVMVGILVLAGAGLAHPNVLLSYLVILIPLLGASVWVALLGVREPGGRTPLIVRSVLLAVAVPFTLVAFALLRPPEEASIWQPYLSVSDAVGTGILFAAGRLWPAWSLALLSMIGVYAAFRWRRNRSIVVAHGFLLGLWVAAAAMAAGGLRTFLVGVWYNDSYRLASLLPMTGLVLAAMGIEQLARLINAGLARVDLRGLGIEHAVAVVLTLSLVFTTQTTSWLNRAMASFAETFAIGPDSPLVSTDEYAIIEAAGSIVPDGATIATDPWNGSSMVYALTGKETTTTHVAYVVTTDLATINAKLDEAASDPSVCDAVNRLNVRYVLDFGPKEVHGGDHDYPGFDQLAAAPGFEVVASQGNASLYRLTACG